MLDALGLKRGNALVAAFKTASGETRIEAPLVASFSDVPEGQALAYLNSDNQLAFALNQGDFAKTHRLVEGAELRVTRKE
jgi:S-adenosylmethionine hydrolase